MVPVLELRKILLDPTPDEESIRLIFSIRLAAFVHDRLGIRLLNMWRDAASAQSLRRNRLPLTRVRRTRAWREDPP